MGVKLNWSGLALILVSDLFHLGGSFALAGGILLVVGVVLMWLDK